MKRNNTLILLAAVLIWRLIYILMAKESAVIYNSDSVTYFADADLLKGMVDPYRTPLYIYVIKFFRFFSEEYFVRNIIVFQHAISFLSLIPFFYVSIKILKKFSFAAFSVVFYGCFPLIIDQNANLNPESLAITGSVFLIYLIVSFSEKPGIVNSFSTGFFPFILIMLKPAYIVTLPIVCLMIAAMFLLYRKKSIMIPAACGWAAAVVITTGYCALNKTSNGEFSLTRISMNNDLANIVLSKAYYQSGDPEFIELIESQSEAEFVYASVFLINNDYIDRYKALENRFPGYLPPNRDMRFSSGIPDIENYPAARIKTFISNSKSSPEYYKYIFRQLIRIVWKYKVLMLMMAFLSYCLYLLYKAEKRFSFGLSFCILYVLAQLLLIGIGGIDDWNRLLIPVYPCIIIIIASFFSVVTGMLDKEKLLRTV